MTNDESLDIQSVLAMTKGILKECETMLLDAYQLTKEAKYEDQAAAACAAIFYVEKAIQQESATFFANFPLNRCIEA